MANSALDAGARATGADADGGFAGSGRRRWCRRRSELPGHRQRSQIPQHRQWWRQRLPSVLWSRARARRRRFQRALTPTDLHRPAGRRCGWWPTSTVLFSGIVVGRFRRRTLALARSAAKPTSAAAQSRDSAARDGEEPSRLTGRYGEGSQNSTHNTSLLGLRVSPNPRVGDTFWRVLFA